jgi:hypothetical protein
MLDIRSLWHALGSTNCHLKFLGFNTAADTHVAEHEVRSLGRVAADSKVLPDAFQSIAKTMHPAHQELYAYGPFDVVNLDFCDSLLPDQEDDIALKQYYDALYQLIWFQIRKRTEPWLLFLTTRLDQGQIHQEGSATMVGQPLTDNCTTHQDFLSEFKKLVPGGYPTAEPFPLLTSMPMGQLTKCYGVMLGKWLMKMGQDGTLKWEVELLTSYSYVSDPGGGATMLSLAYRFTRREVPPQNPSRDSGPRNQEDWEKERALNMIRDANRISDVEVILRNDDAKREEIRASSVRLMVEAGYPEAEYDAFLKGLGE